MEWKQVHIPKPELEKKQADYMKEALEMAKRAPAPPVKKKAPPAPEPVIVEKVVEKIVEVEKPVVERVPLPIPVINKTAQKADIHIDNSKKIEINADVDLNINAAAIIEKGKQIFEKAVHPGPEPIPPDMLEPIPEPVIEPEPEEIVFPEEVMGEVCEEETDQPFAGFESCDDLCNKPRPTRRCCENSQPPNFHKFISEHNKRSCCENSARRPSGNSRPPAGGFSWKDFKKN